MWYEIGLLLLGLVVLLLGAEWMIRGSTRIATAIGVSSLVVGLTVVAFGTSAPELFVSAAAVLNGTADLAVGNVVGSNICNILLIVGLATLVTPMKIPKDLLRRELPIMVAVTLFFFLLSLDGEISRGEGLGFVVGIALYIYMNYQVARNDKKAAQKLDGEKIAVVEGKPFGFYLKSIVFMALGLACMVYGAKWIVFGATTIARYFHISELVIGITLVAIGTSLPEIATTLVAAKKGEGELALGNAVGSNIFNVMCVIGITASLVPLTVNETAIRFDMPFMVFSSFFVFGLMLLLRQRFGRGAGIVMLLVYFIYIFILFQGQAAGGGVV